MDEFLVFNLISQGENEGQDFKRELNLDSDAAKAEFVKDVISIANSAPKERDFVGYLLVGIENNGNVIGIDNIEEERIQQIVHSHIRPVVKLDCSLIKIANNGLPIGVIKITGDNRPYSVVSPFSRLNQDDVFVRQGSIITKASKDEILRMNSETEDYKFVSRYIKAYNSHFELGRYEDALKSINEAIKISPTMDNFLLRAKVYSRLLDNEFNKETMESILANSIQDLSSAISLAITEPEEISVKLENIRLCEKYFIYHLKTNEVWYYNCWDYIDHLKSHLEGVDYGELLYIECLIDASNLGIYIDNPIHVVDRVNEVLLTGFESSGIYELRSRAHYCMHNFGLALIDIEKAVELSKNNLKKRVDYSILKCGILAKTGKYQDVSIILQEIDNLWNKNTGEKFNFYWTLTFNIEDELFWRFGIDQKYGNIDNKYDNTKKNQAKLIICVLLANYARNIYIVPSSDGPKQLTGRQAFRKYFSPIFSSIIDLVGKEFWDRCGGNLSVKFLWE